MQLSFRNRFLDTRDTTSIIVDNNNFKEALKNCFNSNFVVAKYYIDNNVKKESYKN